MEETLTDLQRRFGVIKGYLIEDGKPSTDKDVWNELREIAVRNQEDALADDMQGFVDAYQKRIQLIDEQIKLL